MITKISGELVSVDGDEAILAIDAIQYQVLIPDFVRRRLQTRIGEHVGLYTIEYLEGNPAQGRLTPRLVGFMSIVERQFFEMFCSVDGVGARKALRAMVRPVQDVAEMIADENAKGLTTLPGIGGATADRIIAKLRRKMPRFALLITPATDAVDESQKNVAEEAFEALCALGHSEPDARRLVEAVRAEKKSHKDVESFLQAVYLQAK